MAPSENELAKPKITGTPGPLEVSIGLATQSKNSPHAERQPRESEVSALLRGTSLELIVQKKLEQFVPQPDTYALRDLYHTVMESVERPLITCILNRTAGNQCRAAEILGINRNTLRKKMQALGITTNERRRAS